MRATSATCASTPDAGSAGPEIGFTTTAPGVGTCRLFLDFRHGDAVRTAAFTLATGQPAPASASGPSAVERGAEHQH